MAITIATVVQSIAHPKAQGRLLFKGYYSKDPQLAKWSSMIKRSLSDFGPGCSLIPGARWLCRRRMSVSSTRNSNRAVGIAASRAHRVQLQS